MARHPWTELAGVLTKASRRPGELPMEVVGRGALAGLVATAVLSVLGRLTALVLRASGDVWAQRHKPGPVRRSPPGDPFDREAAVPAAYQGAPVEGAVAAGQGSEEYDADGHAAALSPAAVLAQTEGPGPEAAAAQFARKLVSGLFGRDISQHAPLAGEVVHFTYGGLWGVLYGLVQSSYHLKPGLFGPLFGLLVWLVGPGILVPAMRLMAPPAKEPPVRLAIMIAGHLIYGVAVATTYEVRSARHGRARQAARARGWARGTMAGDD